MKSFLKSKSHWDKIPVIPTTKTSSSISQRSLYIYIYIYLLRKPFTVFTDILEREALLRFQDERHSGGREEGKHSIHPPIARASSNRARKWRKCVAPFKKHRKATLSSSSSPFRARNRKKEGGRRRERACRHTCTVSGGSTGLRGHLAIGHQSIV